MAIQIWEEHQCHRLKERADEVVPLSIFDVHEGVAEVYYREDISAVWEHIILAAVESDPRFIPDTMQWFSGHLEQLESIWNKGRLESTAELLELFELATWAWVGVSISYFLPSMATVSRENQGLGMALRERSVDFLERTDHVLQGTLRYLYPELGDLGKYLTIGEVGQSDIPSREILQARQEHYLYFGFTVHTDRELSELARENDIIIETDVLTQPINELFGQVAMPGHAQGRVRVLRKKSEIHFLEEGEILVTAMTTPDYVPAMRRAGAIVTDEGGIMCHAAIVAREFGKPCVIGTRIATRVLQDGERVDVDAARGVVRRIDGDGWEER